MLEEIVYQNQRNIKKDVTTLLVEAFPINERPPVNYFFANFKRKENILLAYYEKDNFIGFASLTLFEDVAYLFFLAVSPTYRHQGYGGQILEMIKKQYQDYVILLCYEEVNPHYPNYLERKKREKFYLKHQFKNNDFISDEWGVRFQSAYFGKHQVSFETYREIFKIGFGEQALIYLKKAF